MRPQLFSALLGLVVACTALAQPLSTAFTFQGRLDTSGAPASGTYDFRFTLFDAASAGAQLGPMLCSDNISVVNGAFSVQLDFGAQFAGQQRFLEVQVRQDTGLTCSNPAGFVILSPRQNLTAAPNALFSLNTTNAAQLGGQPGAFYTNAANLSIGTIPDTRLSTNVDLVNQQQTITAFKTFTIPPSFSSTLTPPFTVASTSLVTNLNADLFDGLNSTSFVQTTERPDHRRDQNLLRPHLPQRLRRLWNHLAHRPGQLRRQPKHVALRRHVHQHRRGRFSLLWLRPERCGFRLHVCGRNRF